MKTNFAILIDSTGDTEKSIREKYDFDYLRMTVSFTENGEQKEVYASLDYDQGYSVHDFYQILRNGTRIYTAQVNASEIQLKFREYLDKGLDILYIACSSRLSKSVDAAEIEARKLREEYPDRRIVCFDSKISGHSQCLMAIHCSEMREEGKSLDEAVAWLDANKNKFNQIATVENLKYLALAGRVKSSKAFFGNLFAVKPIIMSDCHGNNTAVKKVKGRKPAIAEIVKMAVEAAEGIENQTVYIGHADDLEAAEIAKEELLRLAKPKDVYVGPIGPIIGCSTGPGTIIITVFGKEVTVDGDATK